MKKHSLVSGLRCRQSRLTRRSFLKQTSAWTAALGLLPAVSSLAAIPYSMRPVPELPAKFPGPLILHVSNVAAGEMTLLVGAREVVFRDPEVVARLLKAARQTSETARTR